MDRPIVVLTRRLLPQVEDELAEQFELRPNPEDHRLTPAELGAALAEGDAVVCTVGDRLDAAVFDGGRHRARLVANYGVGFDHIDLSAACRHGIRVTNTPDVLTDATAELAITLLLMAARRAGEGERELRAGRWSGWRPTHLIGRAVTGRTLGVVGLGRIGRATAERARRGFGMRILYVSRAADPGVGAEYRRCADLDQLCAEADFVSLHVPATPETRHLLDARRLQLMRRDGVLINTARGSVVDEAALAAALRDGVIAAAGLDVYAEEPRVHPDLLRLENVVLLPHLGSATAEARLAMGRRVLANLSAFFAGGDPPDRIA